MLKTTDGGISWNFFPADGNPHLTGNFFLDVNTGWSFSDNGLIYKFTDLTTEVESGLSSNPANFTLTQNYPNPFNPSTTLKYTLAQEGLVTLRIYDMLGREVSELLNEIKPAGEYEINFDASKLSSGTYFYQLRSNGSVITRKMSLIK